MPSNARITATATSQFANSTDLRIADLNLDLNLDVDLDVLAYSTFSIPPSGVLVLVQSHGRR